MSSDIAIKVVNLSKCYQIYDQPRDRLKQFTLPRLQNIVGLTSKKYFREFWALKDVSFEIKKGETIGIIGRNGSGKSTLLQMICGTLNPTNGSITTHGRIAALLELGSGFNPEFTGRENVYMNAAVLGLSSDEIDERFDEILAFADIGDFIEQPVKTYSSGMVMRLAFAVAINVEPQILIVDEALSVGDEIFQRKCFSRIEAIRANGVSIIFVSHSGAQTIEIADRAMIIDGGKLLGTGLPKEIVGYYHKLLYAPYDKQEAIRDEILHLGSNAINLHQQYKTQSGREQNAQESYDPYLLPESTIEYEARGAIISDVGIYSPTGTKINNLISGKGYRYKYKVIFLEQVTNVLFGMLIKTISGIELGGATSASSLQKAIPNVQPGTEYEINFNFDCNLNPGTYFVNAGIYALSNGEAIFLHRILDACIFRVLPESDMTASGFVNFNCTNQISVSSSKKC